MEFDQILQPIVDSIEEAKGLNVQILDVRELTDVTDHMVVVSGTSVRHVKSIMKTVVERLTDLGCKPNGVEGEQHSQWILLDYSSVIVHVMLAETREFYDLERLWDRTLKNSVDALDEKALG